MKNKIETQSVFQLIYLKTFQKLRNYSGSPPAFWRMYLDTLVKVCGAKAGIIALSQSSENKLWRPVAFSPDTPFHRASFQKIHSILNTTDLSHLDNTAQLIEKDNSNILAIKLNTGSGVEDCIALLSVTAREKMENVTERSPILEYLHDIPSIFQLRKIAADSVVKQEQFSGILDLMALLHEKERYLAAAMTFCNELASRFHCDRVSLGWQKGKYIRLQALSHSDDFEKKMDAIKKLELAMEETFEQNNEIVLPVHKDNKCITRDHESFARSQDVQFLCSIPLRSNNEPVAVCMLERNTSPFLENEQQLLHLYCDQALKRLHDLKNNDRWIGALFANKARSAAGKLLGFKHTGAKLIGMLISALLLILCLIPVTYRLESTAILRTDDVTYLTAPFNSHIDKVLCRVGDEVKMNQGLLLLDKNELILEEDRLKAERYRYQRESEKARAVDELADMRIAEALKNQAEAKLELIQYQLDQVQISTPYDGIIVEGDQMERIGAPVEQGEILFKVAKIEKMYIEIEVSEKEIHHVNTSLNGDIALVSRPQKAFPINVTRIEPAAVVKEKGNVFIVHGELNHSISQPKWWRPGMTGVAKLNAGKKTLLWIFTHRTIDFLRLKFWW